MKSNFSGWGSGFLGMLIFSGSLPATRVAIGGFSPLFLTSARAVIAALIGALLLWILSQGRPQRRDWTAFSIVALGVVVGFPLLTALALQHVTSAHSMIFIGLMPMGTAIFGVLRGGECPRARFWIFSALGSAVVAGYALAHGTGASAIGDLLMVAAILVCSLGYAEGARLTRRYGGWQVISWALILSLPPMLALAVMTLPASWAEIDGTAWLGLGYVSIFSMLIGFLFWYRGLALGGTAGVGQLQLLQPFFGMLLAGGLLHEPVAPSMVLTAGVIVVLVGLAKRFA